MSADLILYALIAAGLVFWLRSVLGTRHGEERDRPNPFATPLEKAASAQPDQARDNVIAMHEGQEDAPAPLPANFTMTSSAEKAVQDIARTDPVFDLSHFAHGAGDAFAYVVESFADGDRDALKDLLAPPVYDAFESALKEREEKGETAQSDIHAVRKVELIEAQQRERMIYLTVRFTTEETNVTRDKEGVITSGDPDRVSEMVNVWTFGRVLKAKDPRWLVYRTDGADEDIAPGDA